MPKTIFNQKTYPNEDQDPYFTTITNFYNQNDLLLYMNKVRSTQLFAGGGTRTFDSGTGLLSWTEDFVLKNAFNGFLTQFVYGPDGVNREVNLQDGQILYGEIPSSQTVNASKNVFSADKLPDLNDNYVVIAFRHGNSLYFSDGIIL